MTRLRMGLKGEQKTVVHDGYKKRQLVLIYPSDIENQPALEHHSLGQEVNFSVSRNLETQVRSKIVPLLEGALGREVSEMVRLELGHCKSGPDFYPPRVWNWIKVYLVL
jgi:hypothetical protein